MDTTIGTSAPKRAAVRRPLARWISMKLRYLPWKRQKGCRALTTPAPRVQRLPAPPAKASTAASPAASAASPACRSADSSPWAIESSTSPSATSSMTVLVGRRFWAKPIRPVRRSERICSCNSGSNPLASRIDFKLPWRLVSSLGVGNKAPSSISVEPASRACVRQAAAKRVISLRTAGLSCRVSCRSHCGAQIA